jgi:hypothetical protein
VGLLHAMGLASACIRVAGHLTHFAAFCGSPSSATSRATRKSRRGLLVYVGVVWQGAFRQIAARPANDDHARTQHRYRLTRGSVPVGFLLGSLPSTGLKPNALTPTNFRVPCEASERVAGRGSSVPGGWLTSG